MILIIHTLSCSFTSIRKSLALHSKDSPAQIRIFISANNLYRPIACIHNSNIIIYIGEWDPDPCWHIRVPAAIQNFVCFCIVSCLIIFCHLRARELWLFLKLLIRLCACGCSAQLVNCFTVHIIPVWPVHVALPVSAPKLLGPGRKRSKPMQTMCGTFGWL